MLKNNNGFAGTPNYAQNSPIIDNLAMYSTSEYDNQKPIRTLGSHNFSGKDLFMSTNPTNKQKLFRINMAGQIMHPKTSMP
jgi:hypothetical protein